jgi:regulator of RNase E activity RraA
VKLQSDIQNVVINPGDYLIGDLNGVVCLPKNLAEKAISLIAPQVEADVKIATDVQKGSLFSEASKKHRAGLPKA